MNTDIPQLLTLTELHLQQTSEEALRKILENAGK